MTQAQTPIRIARDRRSFIVEYQPDPLATGWVLRKHRGDGWPTMAGPCQSAADAISYIDELTAAGLLADYEDEHGTSSTSRSHPRPIRGRRGVGSERKPNGQRRGGQG